VVSAIRRKVCEMAEKEKIPEGCKGCKWLSSFHCYHICDYWDYEDHGLRGCPPGVGCIRYEKGKHIPDRHAKMMEYEKRKRVNKQMENKKGRFNPKTEALRMSLYQQGKTCRQIAEETGSSISAIHKWAETRGLKPNSAKAEDTAPEAKPAIAAEPEVIKAEPAPQEAAPEVHAEPEVKLAPADIVKDEQITSLIERSARLATENQKLREELSHKEAELGDAERAAEDLRQNLEKMTDRIELLIKDNDKLRKYLGMAKSLANALAIAMEVK